MDYLLYTRKPRFTIGTLLLFFFALIACEATVSTNVVFVQTKDARFVINGSPFLFNGFNAYWMMNLASDPTQRAKVSEVFKEASAAGLTVCRTWAFADGGYRALQISPGVYDEGVFQGLDFAISEARKYGIRLILSLVNNYNDFGGRPQYAKWARDAGVQVKTDDDFYTNPVIRGYYKNHVRKVLTRLNTITRIAYRDDSTIMAWELINEPRCQSDYSGKTFTGWVQEMASFVKSLDRNHLVEIGLEGFYGDTRKQNNPGGYQFGTDFISNNLVREIDFATIHAYPDIWFANKSGKAQLKFMDAWILGHWDDAKKILKKPLILAEFGKSRKDLGYNLNARDMFMSSVYKFIFKLAGIGGTMSGSLVWQLLAQGMDSYDDGYEIILSQNPSTAGIISKHSQAMKSINIGLNTRD